MLQNHVLKKAFGDRLDAMPGRGGGCRTPTRTHVIQSRDTRLLRERLAGAPNAVKASRVISPRRPPSGQLPTFRGRLFYSIARLDNRRGHACRRIELCQNCTQHNVPAKFANAAEAVHRLSSVRLVAVEANQPRNPRHAVTHTRVFGTPDDR